MGKPERKSPLRRPQLRWENYIELDLKETAWKLGDWIHLARDD
jgi:hypothetical protein